MTGRYDPPMSEIEDRLAAIEQRLGMSEPEPFDRMSSLDLRLDAIQNLMQSFGLTQSQMDRKITSIETLALRHGRMFERMELRLNDIISLLTVLADESRRGDGAGDDQSPA